MPAQAGVAPGPSEATPSTAGSVREALEKPPFYFDRYVNGCLMAEGVCIEKRETLNDAMVEAARIASKGVHGKTPVLVYVPAALSAPVEAPVAVKPLEWTVETKRYMSIHCGRGLGLLYQAAAKCYSSGWVVTLGEEVVYNEDDGDQEAAKAAAQADYEQRILSAIDTGGRK
jgi:hypothetical protein